MGRRAGEGRVLKCSKKLLQLPQVDPVLRS